MLSTGWRGAARPACALSALVCCVLYGSAFFGCGQDSGDSDDNSSTGGSSGSGGSGAATIVASTSQPRPGECMSGADCGREEGTACATVAGGYRVCTVQAPVATTASAAASVDECGPGRACASGNCFQLLTFATGQCGAAAALLHNVCRTDSCMSDADCSAMGGVCGPRGFTSDDKVQGGAIRQCLKAACKSSAECTAQAGGMCALVQGACIPAANGAQTFLPAQLGCVYPNGCTSYSDCPSGATCQVVDGKGVCVR